MAVQPSLRRIGKYVVIDVIGTGGMGIVFRAEDPTLGRTVAIKMLRVAESGGVFDRFFLREMKSTGNLHHKNIVTVYDSGEQDGSPYLVMEYLEGEPVSKLISEQRALSLVEKLEIIIQVCDGLQYAHDRSIVHRDIKPANVILLRDGTAKIVDFGVARAGGETSIIQTGNVVGSLYYMSPEQVNSVPLDARSDIFSTGVMLYELLTHELPFKGVDASSTFVKILRADPAPLEQFLKGVPSGLQHVLDRALAKNVVDRYQSAEEFSFDLLTVQTDLKNAIVADCMKRAEAAMARNDFDRARVLLLEVTRFDRQNERANRMLRELRTTLQRQQRSAQIIQMRSQAQVALTEAQYEEALACAGQALQLDPADQESIRLCEEIRNTIARAKSVREAITRAEAALLAGDFDEAKEAIEESLRLDPSDAEARAMALVVNKELAERSRRQRVQEFVDLARRGIAERKFADALDALHHAEELDPSDSNVRELLQWAQRGQEQENKRRILQEITDQIEKALHGGDFSSACTISDMGLQRFPDEPMLLRLRAISEKQRDIAERRRFVHDKSLEVRLLTDQGKLAEAVQELAEALKKYPGEPNFESLLTATKAEIERQRSEREAVARQKAMQQAEAEARAKQRRRILDLSIGLRRSLDAHTKLTEISRRADQLRSAIDAKHVDDQSREVATLLFSEVDARLRAREQAAAELDQVRQLLDNSRDSESLNEAENRLSSIKAAFPSETNIQQTCLTLEGSLLRVREDLERAISSLSAIVQSLETTSTGDLLSLQQKAKEGALAFATDPRVGALMQQIDSFVSRRLERNSELARDMMGLLKDLSESRSLEEISRTVERARSIVALDKSDRNLADIFNNIEAEAVRVRQTMTSLLQEMASVAQAVAEAPTVHASEALISQVRALADAHAGFKDLQDSANRVLAEIQGRRIEHDLIVHELESVRSSLPILDTDDELNAAAARAGECRSEHRDDPTIITICGLVEEEVSRILRDREVLRQRNIECENALRLSEDLLQQGDLQGALEALRAVEAKAPDRIDLRLQISIVRKAIEQEREENERLDQERHERERAEGETQARRMKIEAAIQETGELLAMGRGEEALKRLHSEQELYPESEELQSAFEVMQIEVERLRAEQEHLAQELAEARTRARRASAQQAIHEAAQLEDRHKSEDAWRILVAALERDPDNQELQAATQSAREKADKQRAERARIEQERAEAEAQARQEAAERAMRETRELLSIGRNDDAVDRLRKALERDPQSQDLQTALEATQAKVARDRAEKQQLEQERQKADQLARDHAALEARLRLEAARQAIQQSQRLLQKGQNEEALQCLRKAIEADAENQELRTAFETAQSTIARERAEKERLERERLAREKAEAEARASLAAADEAMQQARSLLRDGEEDRAVECLQQAIARYPENNKLRAFLDTTQAEIVRQRAARERLERERVAKEKLAAEARARQAAAEEAIRAARELQSKDLGNEALQQLRTALEQDPQNKELRAAFDATKATIERLRAEKERLEREQKAREQAEKEARARQAAIDQAVRDAGEMLARGQNEPSLQHLQQALKRFPGAAELRQALESTQAEVDRRRAEQERREQERLKQERAEAEAKARAAAIADALRTAKAQLAQGLVDKSAQGVRAALKRYPDSVELQAALQATETEAARMREERERGERERIAREQAEAKERARLAAANEAVQKAQKLLAKGQGDEAIQCLRGALERDRQSKELRSALESTQAEVNRQRAEREKAERDRVAKEQSAARARKEEIDKALQQAGKLHAEGKSEEALQLLRASLKRFPDSQELRSAVGAVQEDINQQRAEKQRAAEREAKAKAAEKAKAAAASKAAAAKTVSLKKPAQRPNEQVAGPFADRRRAVLIASVAGALIVLGAVGGLIVHNMWTKKPVTHTSDPAQPPRTDSNPHTAFSSLSIVSNAGDAAAVSLDGSQLGDLSSHPDALSKLGQGPHHVLISRKDGTVDLSIQVSSTGALQMDSATGLNQNPVLALTQSGERQEIYCRCEGTEIRIDDKKARQIRRDFYAVPGKGGSDHEVTLARSGQTERIPLVGANERAGTVVLVSFGQPPIVTIPPYEQAWQLIKTSQNLKDFKDFIIKYPSNPHTAEAIARCADLDWERIRNSTIEEELQAFAGAYPNSPHAAEARTTLERLAQARTQQTAQKAAEQKAAEQKAAAQKAAEQKAAEQKAAEQKAAEQKAAEQKAAEQKAADQKTAEAEAQKHADERDRQAILGVLAQYRSAYEARDFKRLASVWPNPPASFQQTFKISDKISLKLDPQMQPSINGDTATVQCIQSLEIVIDGKKQKQAPQTRLFRLQRVNGRWVIQNDN